jgi:DNA repair protein RadC
MYILKIKDIPKEERPRERLIKYGTNNLSNEELLSIILKTGSKKHSVKQLALILLSEIEDITKLKDITISKLIKIDGIGKVKAIELLASIELGKRIFQKEEKLDIKLNNSEKIYEYFKDMFLDEKQENFYAIYLDSKSKLISYKLLFKGTLNSSCVHPREIFKHAHLESAYSIIVLHNHPSGDSTPSKQDEETTMNLMKIGKLMSIPVVDHIIIGKDNYFSFYEYMNNKRI